MTTIHKYLAVLLLGCALSIQMAHAVTNVVLPGESIQVQINLSGDGDTVAIFGGTYSEDLVITQAVRLAEVSGQDVIINGSVLISGVINPPPLEGFAIGSSGRGLTISNTPGILLNSLDLRTGSGLAAKGSSDVRIQNSQISAVSAGSASIELTGTRIVGDLHQTTGRLYTVDCNIGGSIYATNSAGTSVVFRTVITNLAQLRGSLSIVAYSRAKTIWCSGNTGATIRIVGCLVNETQRLNVDAVSLGGTSNNILVANCQMYNYDTYNIAIGPTLQGVVINNYVAGGNNTSGIYNYGIDSSSTGVKIINNIVVSKLNGIKAPFGSIVKGCCVYSVANRYIGGVVPTEDINANPLFNQSTHILEPGSPCIDGGSTDARYRDRDGSRADVGPTGGAWYDPAGWTSDVPVAVSFDLSTDQYLEGTLAEVVLSGGSAVSVP